MKKWTKLEDWINEDEDAAVRQVYEHYPKYNGDYPHVNIWKGLLSKHLYDDIKKRLSSIGWTVKTVKSSATGHFELSLFATKDDKVIYISTDDWRYANKNYPLQLLVRKAKEVGNYSNHGHNNNTDLENLVDTVELLRF